MEEVIRKEILQNLDQTINILEKRETEDIEKLKKLSDQAIEDVALYKDLEIISITVLIYSLYKTVSCLQPDDYQKILSNLKAAKDGLQNLKFRKYNLSVKTIFEIVRGCNAKINEHLQDVMQAARIKKGSVLLQKGLSIGQAAGLMGLTNWDLQQYAGQTPLLGEHHEKISANKRLQRAFKIFGLNGTVKQI